VTADPAAGRPRILLLDTDLETRNHYIILAMRDALLRQPEVGAVILAPMLDAIELFRAERCDHFIAVGSARAQAPVLARLCALARRSALWTTEDPYELADNLAHSQGFDHVFSNDLACAEAYGGRGSHLPLAASPLFQDLPVRADDAAYRYDLLFIGTAWPNRVAAIDRILGSFPAGLRVKIGLSTNPHLPPVRFSHAGLAQAGLWTGWRTSNAQFARLANVSRVTLGLERRFSSAGAAQAKGSTPPPRLFEVALAGGYQVFLADGDEAARYFVPGVDFALCHELPEVIEAVRWALAHPAERIERARSARARAQQEHLYQHRVRELLRVLDAAPTVLRRPAAGRSRRVLVVTHNLLGKQPGGGVEVYQDLLRRIGPRFAVSFMVPETAGESRGFAVHHPGGEIDRYDLPYALHDRLLHDAAAETLFQRILFDCRIDLVHFQHLLHYPLSLPIISRACGVPSVLTLHDFYLVCSRLNLLDYRGCYCDPAALALATCDICLSATDNLPAGSQTRRRNFVRQVLRAVDLLVANTPWSLEYFGRLFPDLSAARATVLEMCLPAAPPRQGVSAPPRQDLSAPPRKVGAAAVAGREREAGRVLRVVIPGNFTDVKGGHQLVRLFNLMRGDAVRFTILGLLTAPFPEIFAALQFPNVSVRGGYRAEEVFGLLAEHEMSLHLSIWPETYVISLSEAWASGLVPIVSRLGALGERVTDGRDGFVVDPYDLGRTASLLRRFAEDPGDLAPLAAQIAAKRLVTPALHLAQLREIYERLIAEHPVRHAGTAPAGAGGFQLSTTGLGLRTNHARWDVEENVWDEPLEVAPDELTAAGTVGRGAVAADAIRDLPAEVAAGIDLARCMLDELAVDGVASEAGIAVTAVGGGHRLEVAGWSFRPYFGPPARRFLRLRRPSFSRVYEADAVSRPDIATLFGDPAAAAAGFFADIRLESLPGGTFWLDLMAVYDGHVFEYRSIARLDVVASSALGARRRQPSMVGRKLAALPAEYGGLAALVMDCTGGAAAERAAGGARFSLDRFTGDAGVDAAGMVRLSASGGQRLSLDGWAFCPAAGMPLDMVCRVRGPGEAALYAAGVRRRLDVADDAGSALACEGGFALELAGAGLPEGVHHVDLVQIGERQIAEFVDVGRFVVVA
jgi:glycosyltransferase involved in cell wall biosynthesis